MSRRSQISLIVLLAALALIVSRPRSITIVSNGVIAEVKNVVEQMVEPKYPPFDKDAYDAKMLALANLPPPKAAPTSTAASSTAATTTPAVIGPWPVRDAPYPDPGAVLPFKRVVAYYGNLYSTKMGVLGEYPEEQMLGMLMAEVRKWEAADPTTPVAPALHYIAVTAQGSPGEAGMYRLRMPASEIDKVLAMAAKIDALVFLDVQVGFSNVKAEVPLLEKYLKLPHVHLALDPEFSMKTGRPPGTVIGTTDAADINYVAEYLAKIVRDNRLPPKMLIVHRFTQPMLTNAGNIRPLPEVQVVIDADGFGNAPQKIRTYKDYIAAEPVQFTGFKLFYKNDPNSVGGHLMAPEEVLRLSPQPSYIQYQ